MFSPHHNSNHVLQEAWPRRGNTTNLGASKNPLRALLPASAPDRRHRRHGRCPHRLRSALLWLGAECCCTCRSLAEQTGANRRCLAWRNRWSYGDCCSGRSSVDSGLRASKGDILAVACSHFACGSYPPANRNSFSGTTGAAPPPCCCRRETMDGRASPHLLHRR